MVANDVGVIVALSAAGVFFLLIALSGRLWKFFAKRAARRFEDAKD